MPTTACLRRSGLNYVSRRDVLEHLLLQREIGHTCPALGYSQAECLMPLVLGRSHRPGSGATAIVWLRPGA